VHPNAERGAKKWEAFDGHAARQANRTGRAGWARSTEETPAGSAPRLDGDQGRYYPIGHGEGLARAVSYLLDTHVWVWSQEAPERFGARTRRELTDTKEELLISAISTFEIARLLHLGVLRLKHRFAEWKELSMAELRASPIDLTHEIAWEAYNLPGRFHNDPADRLLVATARVRNLTMVTGDDLILRYPHVNTLSAKR
jgi:PIN domain nuclease of toxin-antitoxin system